MKQYITGIVAVIIAIGAVAFTMPKKSARHVTSVTFYYQPSNYSSTEVPKKGNWSSTVTPPTCIGAQNKACKLVIDAAQTTGGLLNNDIIAMPGNGGAGSGYVPNPTTTGYVSRNDKP